MRGLAPALTSAFVHACGRLVPSDIRREWREEWKAEVGAASSATRSAEESKSGTLWLWPGVLADAVATRRHWPVLRWKRGSMQSVHDEGGMMDGLWQDTRQTARNLLRRPVYLILASSTLALGIGASTAMFSAVYSVLLSDLPYEDVDRLFALRQSGPRSGTVTDGVSAANAYDLAELTGAFQTLGFADGVHGLRMVREDRAESLRAWVVSAGFFDALGAQPSAGRLFSDDEYLEGNEAVVMLSHGTWLARFGGDPSILGQELVLDDLPHRVVGVLSADFRYPSRAEAWTPRPRRSWDAAQRSRPTMRTVGKLEPGTSEADARRELDRLASVLGDRYPVENASLDIGLVSLRDEIVGDVEAPLMILFATVVLVLLVASANVAGLQLTRGITQTRALAVRAALGASKARLLRISIIESLLLAAIGGALGVGLAYGGIALIEALGPTHLPRIDELRIDAVVLGFAVLSAIAGSLAAGTLPALVASGTAPSLALAAGGRGGSIGRKGRRMQDALVVGELAVAVSLAVGAGLLVRSFTASMDIDLGFETSGVVAAQVWAYGEGHRSDFEYFDRSLRALRAVPGFEAVGVTSDLPLASDGPLLARRVAVDVELPRAESTEQRVAYMSVMDEAFLGALGIDLVRGRPFREDDDVDGMPVALINETFARTFLGGQDPTGQPIQVGFRDDGAREIVGVVADVRRRGSELPPLPEVYLPHRQVPLNGLTMVVRADLAPASVVSLVRETLMQVDPGQAIWANQPMADLLTDRIRQRRFNTVLLGAFSLIALGLAAVGLYGLIAFQVQRRTREFGIRRALGCTAHGVIADVLRRGALLAGMGLAVGAVGATVVALGLRSMLFGVTALDPTTVVGVSLVFSAITVIAGLGAARRAVRVSPSIAVTAAE